MLEKLLDGLNFLSNYIYRSTWRSANTSQSILSLNFHSLVFMVVRPPHKHKHTHTFVHLYKSTICDAFISNAFVGLATNRNNEKWWREHIYIKQLNKMNIKTNPHIEYCQTGINIFENKRRKKIHSIYFELEKVCVRARSCSLSLIWRNVFKWNLKLIFTANQAIHLLHNTQEIILLQFRDIHTEMCFTAHTNSLKLFQENFLVFCFFFILISHLILPS